VGAGRWLYCRITIRHGSFFLTRGLSRFVDEEIGRTARFPDRRKQWPLSHRILSSRDCEQFRSGKMPVESKEFASTAPDDAAWNLSLRMATGAASLCETRRHNERRFY
jgi:hypothetical protein